MAEWTRVKDKRTGHEYSVAHVNEDAHEVLGDKPATRRNGKPLPAKPRVRARRGQRGGGSQDLNSLTVPELQDRAKKAKVEGYSTMNKDQLVAALEGAK